MRNQHSGRKCGYRTISGAACSDSSCGFLAAWQQLLGPVFELNLPRRRGRKPRVALTQVIAALIFHLMNGSGTLAQHFWELFNEPYAESSISDRRSRLPWDLFAELMRRALRPRANRRRHPEAFWRGWRLVALDGTQFSLSNTPQIKPVVRKAKTRRGRAAFGKLCACVLLEVGLHNPLAAAIGRKGQAEWELGNSLLSQLPKGVLLVADRLYGCARFASALLEVCQRVGSQFLLRARSNVKVQRLKRFEDGSWLVRVPVRKKGNPNLIERWLQVREIRARVGRRGFRSLELRLWTSLLEPGSAPALEVAQLYAQRWEEELYFRELKRQLRKNDLLQSHTVETAAQEVAAMVLASSLLAAERVRVAAGQVAVLRVSFIKVLEALRPLWMTLDLAEDVLSESQKDKITQRFYKHMRRFVTPKRRSRSCPRAVRQSMTDWPRLRRNHSVEAPLNFELL